MRVEIAPTNARDYRAYITPNYHINGQEMRIVDDSLTNANTIAELVANHQIARNDRLHFIIHEIIFEDVHYSSRHEEVYTVESSGSEFLMTLDTVHDSGVNVSTIPILSEVRSTEASILRVFRLELLLEGILKTNAEYIPIEDVIKKDTTGLDHSLQTICPECHNSLEEYRDVSFCPKCGSEITNDENSDTEIYEP